MRTLIIGITILFCLGTARAQLPLTGVGGPPPPSRHPTERFAFDVHFEGKDGKLIEGVSVILRLKGQPKPEQANLLQDTPWAGTFSPDEKGVFHTSITVPDLIAEGDYAVSFQADTAGAARLSIQYDNVLTVHISNDATFEKPRIIAVPRP